MEIITVRQGFNYVRFLKSGQKVNFSTLTEKEILRARVFRRVVIISGIRKFHKKFLHHVP